MITRVLVICLLFAGPGLPREATAADPPRDKSLDDQIRPFLAKHCLECHGQEKPKGKLRLDQLSADFGDAAARERWLAVLERVKTGVMPPKGKPRPADQD